MEKLENTILLVEDTDSIILLFTFVLVKIIRKVLERRTGDNILDKTQLNFLKHFLSGVVYFVGILMSFYVIPQLRSISLSIFAGSGILAVVLGFASQQAMTNIVNGIFIAIFKPFRIGDRVRVVGKDIIGVVEDVNLRHTVLKTVENQRIVVPNGIIGNEIIENANIIDEKIKSFIKIGIGYNSNIDNAINIIKKVLESDVRTIDNRNEAEIEQNESKIDVKVIALGESSVDLRAGFWAKDNGDSFEISCTAYKKIKEEFAKNDIEIPYPYRTVVIKNS